MLNVRAFVSAQESVLADVGVNGAHVTEHQQRSTMRSTTVAEHSLRCATWGRIICIQRTTR